METELRTAKIKYWACMIDSHQHRVRAVAERCILRSRLPKKTTPDFRERNIKLTRDYVDVLGPKDVAIKYGMETANVSYVAKGTLYKAAKLSSEVPPCPFSDIRLVRVNKRWWLEKLQLLEKSWKEELNNENKT